ncbi:hypothetical protein H2O64_20320 [Kordia sp. YSTF-M3]|uniref:Bacteriocin n=1 Tax=Kordia aestuariivivens TaxID=2759037 RepID=A0ABR7QEQ6_9FLAO|nr:hypothetical protein [Kordia aestuariivivens]MBC8757029.1 hypothetical protein [Kordia aestuariivivens]
MKKKKYGKLKLNKFEVSNLNFTNSVVGGVATLTVCFSCDPNDCVSDGTHCDCGTIRCDGGGGGTASRPNCITANCGYPTDGCPSADCVSYDCS